MPSLPVLPAADFDYAGGTGLEWMPLASVVIPAILLLLIIWLGSRNTV